MIATIVQSLARISTPPMSGPFLGHHLICQDCSTRPPARLLLVYYTSRHDHKLLWLSAYPEKFNALPIIVISYVSRFISTIGTMATNLSLSIFMNTPSRCVYSRIHIAESIINVLHILESHITFPSLRYLRRKCRKSKNFLSRSPLLSSYLEESSIPFLLFSLSKVSSITQSNLQHFLPLIKLLLSCTVDLCSTMNPIPVHACNVYKASARKETALLSASFIHISGLSGPTPEDMFQQIQLVAEVSGLPINLDAARKLAEERIPSRPSPKLSKASPPSLKSSKDPFSSTSFASLIIPLKSSCHFANNPGVAKICNGFTSDVFEIIQVINDPDSIHTFQRFIIQPWFQSNRGFSCIGCFILASSVDAQSLSDCYFTIREFILDKKLIPSDVFNRCAFMADRIHSEHSSSTTSRRRWGFRLIISDSRMQFSDASLLTQSIRKFTAGKANFDVYGIPMSYCSQNVISKSLSFGPATPNIILCGTDNCPLTYVIVILDALGIPVDVIQSLSYTKSYGHSFNDMLPSPANILVRFSCLSPAIRLAQHWPNLDHVPHIFSPLGDVSIVYGNEISTPLSLQSLEPPLIPLKPIPAYDAFISNIANPSGSITPSFLSTMSSAPPSTSSPVSHGTKRSFSGSATTSLQIADIRTHITSMSRSSPIDILLMLSEVVPSLLNDLSSSISSNANLLSSHHASILRIANTFHHEGLFAIAQPAPTVSSATSLSSSPPSSSSSIPLPSILPPTHTSSLSSKMPHPPSLPTPPLLPDPDSENATLSHGFCGYSTISIIIAFLRKLTPCDPNIYRQNPSALADHLSAIVNDPSLSSFPALQLKIRNTISVLSFPNSIHTMSSAKSLWLSMADVLQLVHCFQLPCRCWYQRENLLFLIMDTTPESLPSCFNIVQNGSHLYLHSSFSHDVIPPPFLITNYSGHDDIVGSSTDPRNHASQPSGTPAAKRILQQSIPQYRSTLNPIIIPTIQSFPDDLLLHLRSTSSRIAPYTDPSSIAPSLATFYEHHSGGNMFVREVYAAEYLGHVYTTLATNVAIPAGTRLFPIVGTLDDEPISFNAPYIDGEYINPTRAAFDHGYTMYLTADEASLLEVFPFNPAYSMRFSWPDMPPPNCDLVIERTNFHTVMWAVANQDIPAHHIIYITRPHIYPPMRCHIGFLLHDHLQRSISQLLCTPGNNEYVQLRVWVPAHPFRIHSSTVEDDFTEMKLDDHANAE